MENLKKLIYERRAVRKYKHASVDQKLITELLNAGRMAPSALNLQPWKFYVVTDRSLIRDMDTQISNVVREIYKMPEMVEFLQKDAPIFHDAPLVFFITAPKVNEWAGLDIGMCAQNIMLTAKSLGLDTCPVGLGKFIEKTSFYSVLGIPPEEVIYLSLVVGYGDEDPPVHERKKDNVVFVKSTKVPA
jgi:nitroreductase